jgi:hypothetical protein
MLRYAVVLPLFATAIGAAPISVHPDNPHYFLFRGKPAVLITSGEHYGALLNGPFDFERYFDALQRDRLNLTRTFAGLYYEVPGDFGITANTLAPQPREYVGPYARSNQAGALDGLNKFDLSRWNTAYFDRLKRFFQAASDRGIVVEFTLFCVYYQDRMWNLSPLHPANNIQGAAVKREEVLTLQRPEIVKVQEAFVRKVVTELRGFDNVLYEICNEPYVRGLAAADWQRHISKVIRDTENGLGIRHLVGENAANFTRRIDDPDPNVSYFAFHYARPPVAVAENYGLGRPIGMNETGFDGTLDGVFRIQAWDFMLAGGAMYNNLDYSFAASHPDGTFLTPGNAPGGGSPELRKQLGILVDYFGSLDFLRMRPARDLIAGPMPAGLSARALETPGTTFAIYVHTGRAMDSYRPRYVYRTDRQTISIPLNLPAGKWSVQWWNTRSGPVKEGNSFDHAGGHAWLPAPPFTEDIAVVVRRSGN